MLTMQLVHDTVHDTDWGLCGLTLQFMYQSASTVFNAGSAEVATVPVLGVHVHHWQITI